MDVSSRGGLPVGEPLHAGRVLLLTPCPREYQELMPILDKHETVYEHNMSSLTCLC